MTKKRRRDLPRSTHPMYMMETRGTSIESGNRSNYTWQHPPKNFGEDNQKIAFVLSYLRKGDADSWAESFQTQKSIGKKPEDALDLRNMDSICNRSRRCIQIRIRRTRCYLRSQQISHDEEHHSRRSCSTLQDIGRQIRTQGRKRFDRQIPTLDHTTVEKNCLLQRRTDHHLGMVQKQLSLQTIRTEESTKTSTDSSAKTRNQHQRLGRRNTIIPPTIIVTRIANHTEIPTLWT